MLLGHKNSDRRKSSLAKLQYTLTSTLCDLQMPDMVGLNIRKMHLLLGLLGIFCLNLFFGGSSYGVVEER